MTPPVKSTDPLAGRSEKTAKSSQLHTNTNDSLYNFSDAMKVFDRNGKIYCINIV
ncbi:hypothetical protein GCM10027286_23610 [Virgibacillus ainsalahensis]